MNIPLSCDRCVMNNTAPNFVKYPDGTCNFCTEFLHRNFSIEACPSHELSSIVSRIKSSSLNPRFDCVIGLSGGVDSSWALVQACELGLKPLVVHLDNGWNSELTQNNIFNLVSHFDCEYISHVIDWGSYKSMLLDFINANVVDLELLMDNSMISLNYRMASQHGIKYILGGTNQSTEGILMPDEWNWFKYDKLNIKSICINSSSRSMKSLHPIGTLDHLYYTRFKNIKWLSFLDFLSYDKSHALKVLSEQYGYKPYPYKHYESILTRFYQGYILPKKFNIDKRILHFSSLIVTGQLSRDTALRYLSSDPYPSPAELDNDINYFCKKLDISRGQLSDYINSPSVPHTHFASELSLWRFIYNSRLSLFARQILGALK